jgi:hypothetical protein
MIDPTLIVFVLAVADYDEVVVLVHPFDIVQNQVFVYEVVLVVHPFGIVQNQVFVYEVVSVVQHNYFDHHHLGHDMTMMDDYNLQNQNYSHDHHVVYHSVVVVDDYHSLPRSIVVVGDNHHDHLVLSEVEEFNHLNVIDLDHHHHRRRHHD